MKQVPQKDAPLKLNDSGTGIREDVSYEVNEPDAYALEEALRQREKHKGEVVVITSGPARAQQVLHLLRPRRTARDHHNLAFMLLSLPQRLFERIGVRLVDLVGNVFANPRARVIELQGCILLRHLLHANQNLQENFSLDRWRASTTAKPVSINDAQGA